MGRCGISVGCSTFVEDGIRDTGCVWASLGAAVVKGGPVAALSRAATPRRS